LDEENAEVFLGDDLVPSAVYKHILRKTRSKDFILVASSDARLYPLFVF
jgi:hypothetical protein